MRMLRDWAIAIAVGLSVFLLVDWLSRGSDPRGAPAPAFELRNATGGTAALADYAGKPVLLNFWGTWCGYCVQEIPAFARWSAKHPEVQILGLSVRSGSGKALADAATRLGITWPVLEADGSVLDAYGVDVFPTTVLIGADGSIQAVVQGALDEGRLDALVASAG